MANTKRRDKKGRVLLDGEQQKSTGLYEYRYYDKYNVRKSIYSWRLTEADPIPKGKRHCEPLRDMERAIDKDLHDQIDSFVSKKATLNDRFDVHIESKINLKASTKQNYIYMYEKYVREGLGRLNMGDINQSIILRFYNDLIKNKGFKPNSMEVMHTVLNPIFDTAVADGIIRSNPCTRAMTEIRKSGKWEPKRISTKEALTYNQQKAFVDFLKSNTEYSRWVNIITVLLGTGMRIGECTGLTWNDISFKDNTISVNHTIIYRQWEDGKCGYRVMKSPKTKNSIRTIPMFPEVREALLSEKAKQAKMPIADTEIDGYSDWVFLNRYGTIVSPSSVNDAISRVIRDYNEIETAKAKEEDREPDIIPHITNHQLRHSFCTRLVEESCKPNSNINLKVIQTLMGHSDFSTTMDIYTDVSEQFKKDTVQSLSGSIYLG